MGTVVWKALDSRIIPRLERLFTKENTAKTGEKVAHVRPQVILALVELYKRLPEGILQRKLSRLITILSDALKSRDSNSRDLARKTLAKLFVGVGPAFLPDILRELALTLKEGFQLHVRAAAVHSMLLQNYETHFSSDTDKAPEEKPTIDLSVPALMDLLQLDLFGSAQDRKDAEFSEVRYVKEAGGSKSLHSIELIAGMIRLDEEACHEFGPRGLSVHSLVSPLLNRVYHARVNMKHLRQVKECLGRVVQGLSHNFSFSAVVVLPLIYATIYPCIKEDSSEISSSPGQLVEDGGCAMKVVEWRPSVAGMADTAVGARDGKAFSESALRKVADGHDAPKLTGSWRRSSSSSSTKCLDDPGSIAAVTFGLQLLRFTLRRGMQSFTGEQLNPFVPLLTECICRCRDSEAVLLAMRCLSDMSGTEAELNAFDRSSEALASKTLELLVGFGGNEELLQASFKMMMYLVEGPQERGERSINEQHTPSVILNEDQMELLLSFLQTSLTTSVQHNPAMGLVRALVARQVVSPGMYDLMRVVLEQAIKSHKETLRQQASVVYIRFLMTYPISAERMKKELKQLIVNIQFDGVEGRHSAISMVGAVLSKFPDPVIVEHCQLFFLPLTMQLGNDESEKGRRAVSECIATLLSRLPSDALQPLLDYALAWGSNSDYRLKRASMSVLGIFVDAGRSISNVDPNFNNLMLLAVDSLDAKTEWEILYFALVLLEKVHAKHSARVSGVIRLWPRVLACISGCHPWVDLVSLRLLSQHMQSLDPCTFVDEKVVTFLQDPGNLFEVSHVLCSFLDCEEEQINDDAVALAIKGLTFSLKASNRYPHLCFAEGDSSAGNPVQWLLTRLSQIAKPKGPRRRQAVFKCFGAFANYGDGIIYDYLGIIIEPLHRVERETMNDTEMRPSRSRSADDFASEESQVAKDVLHLLEQLCSPHDKFVEAYGRVKRRAQDKKVKRSEESRYESARDPRIAAVKKVEKQMREKQRRKRRVEERTDTRGAKYRRQQY